MGRQTSHQILTFEEFVGPMMAGRIACALCVVFDLVPGELDLAIRVRLRLDSLHCFAQARSIQEGEVCPFESGRTVNSAD